MNKNYIIFILCFFILFVNSQDFENTQGASAYHDYTSKFNVQNSFTIPSTSSTSREILCVGTEYDVDSFINEKDYTYSNMEIKTMCNNKPGTELENIKVCSGYETLSGVKSGLVGLISSTRLDNFETNYVAHYAYSGSNSIIEPLLLQWNSARLSKFYTGSGGVDMDAKGRTGVGCVGSYNYKIRKDGTTLKTFTGELSDNVDSKYTFTKEGNYEIIYSSSIEQCVSFYEEKYIYPQDKTKVMHPFTRQVDSSTKTTTKTLYVQVINSDGPTYTQPEGNVNCGLTYTGGIIFLPPSLVEGQSVIIPAYMTITNPFDVPIYINGINHKYKVEKYIGWGSSIYLDTNDITSKIKKSDPCISKNVQINPLGQIICGPLEIKPKQKVTIKLDIESELVVDEPLEKYYLQVGFDYYYNKPSHGCYEAGSGTGSCPASINVEVIDEPEILKSYSLNANVDYEENIIDREFIEEEKKTVNIFGRVNLTTNDGKVPPTTEWIGDADVELVSLQIPGIGFDCLEKTGLKTKTSAIPLFRGSYRFDDVKLNDVCLEYDITDILVAGIKVDYTTDDGTALTTSSQGQIPVNTALGVLTCDLNYKLTSSNYRPGEGEEEYLITITVENQYQDPGVIEYKCGNEEGEDWKTTTEDEFECAYEFDSVNPEDVIYIAQARVKDNIMEGREAVCNANIGLCLPYV